MGPKGKDAKPSKKAAAAKKEKTVEERTFGLKNKNKSKVVQSYITQVKSSVKGVANNRQDQQKKAKQTKAEMDAAMAELFRAAIVQPPVPPGVDPKNIVCEFFKQNACTKGLRCKFAHDLNAGKKSAKIDLYSDNRDEAKLNDKIEDWDQTKLEDVINSKDTDLPSNQTEIVCKYFLDAIEKSQYGWFWVCPNGGKSCKYRHRLPPGYLFQTKKERDLAKLNKVEEISIEEIIEQQRKKLGPTGGTPVTAESLAKYKAEKKKRLAAEEEKKRVELAKKSGGRHNALSGRALFSYDPTLFEDDANAAGDVYEVQDEEENEGEDEGHDDDEDEEDEDEDEEELETKAVVLQVDDAAKAMDESLYIGDDENVEDLQNLTKEQ